MCVMGVWVFVTRAIHNGCIRSSIAHLDPLVLQVTVDAVSAEAGLFGTSLPM